MLWRGEVIGWGKLSADGTRLRAAFGFVAGRALREAAFRAAREAEIGRIEQFLGLAG